MNHRTRQMAVPAALVIVVVEEGVLKITVGLK